MIHSEEKLYGWGVGTIPMPRALDTLHADKKRRSVELPSATRQRVASKLCYSSGVFRIFIDDFPWRQGLLLTLLSTLILALVSVINIPFPTQQVERLSKPVNIVISMLEEESQKHISPIKEKKPLPKADYDHGEQDVMTKTAIEKQQQIIIAAIKEAKQPINAEKPSNTSLKSLPEAGNKLRTSDKTKKAPQENAPSKFIAKTEPEHEQITISPPTSHQHYNYMGKNVDRVLQQIRSDVVTNFKHKTDTKVAQRILLSDRLQRKYKPAVLKQEKSGNSRQKPATDISTFHRLVKAVEVYSPDTGHSDRGYGFERKDLRHSTSQQSLPTTRFPTLQQQNPVYDSTTLKGRSKDERYILPVNNRYQSLKHGSMNQQISLRLKKQKENLVLVPPAPTKSLAHEPAALTNSPALLTKIRDFSGEILPDEVDPSKLISLKEFNVCKDPEEEFRLKTELAVRLDGPLWLQANGVLFFFNHPESGYTIQVRIYNPQGRIFGDRCELLQSALHGVIYATK